LYSETKVVKPASVPKDKNAELLEKSSDLFQKSVNLLETLSDKASSSLVSIPEAKSSQRTEPASIETETKKSIHFNFSWISRGLQHLYSLNKRYDFLLMLRAILAFYISALALVDPSTREVLFILALHYIKK